MLFCLEKFTIVMNDLFAIHEQLGIIHYQNGIVYEMRGIKSDMCIINQYDKIASNECKNKANIF